ncbi:MAG: helix-turn-helix domain-containing protein [Solobacterium sp.]|nr:helix-turn-helix domain-containing protein [Solobacterium sp.]
MKHLGAFIRDARIQKKMTQDTLAEQLHVTRQTISNYENGKSEPDLETLQKLAEILELDMNEVLNGSVRDVPGTRWYWIALVTLMICGFVLYRYLFILQEYYRMQFIILPEYIIGIRAMIPYIVSASCLILGSLAGIRTAKKMQAAGSLRILIRAAWILYLCIFIVFAAALYLLRAGMVPELREILSQYHLLILGHPLLILLSGIVIGTLNGLITEHPYNALYLTAVPLVFLIVCWLKYRLP